MTLRFPSWPLVSRSLVFVLAVAWAAQRVGFLPYLIALEAVGMFVACRLLGAHIRRRPLRREA